MSPKAIEPGAPRPRLDPRASMRKWTLLSTSALRKVAARRPGWTVFIEANGVAVRHEVFGAKPVRHDGFESWALAHPESRALLVISAALLHTLRVDEIATSANERLQLGATQRFAHYYGAQAASWPIAVSRDGDFACALHGLLLASIVAAAEANRIELLGMVPLWSEAPARIVERAPVLETSDEARLLLVEHRLVTCLSLAGGKLIDVQQRYLDAATPVALDELVNRLEGESAATPGSVVVAGWGIEDVVEDPTRFVLLPLTTGPEHSNWVFPSNARARA